MATKLDDRYDAMSLSEIVSDIGRTVAGGFKAAAQQMLFPGRAHWSEAFVGPKYPIDYAKSVGDGRGNSIVEASVAWAAKNFTEAPLAIEQITGSGKTRKTTPIPDHEFVKLIQRPNPYYSGALLWKATIPDWMFGNAYWRKIRGPLNKVLELWWIPSTLIEPKWEGKDYISYYEYKYDSTKEPERIDPKDIVHFRNGLDPKNTRKGLSPLGSLIREIFTDDEGANYTATLLANLGVPGMVISPASDNGKIAPEDVNQIKQAAETKWSGGNRGKAMVLSVKAMVQALSMNPEQMKVRDVRTIPEERVTARLGIPAIVVGLGAGLQRSTFANMAEAREAAYENFMIPSQRELAEELATQLLIDFVTDVDKWHVFFDLAQVRVLQADENELWGRAGTALNNGLAMLDEVRDLVGLSPLDKDQGKVFYIPGSVAPTPPEELWTAPQPVPAALAAANANQPPNPNPDNQPPSSTGPNSPENAPPADGPPPSAPPAPAKALAAAGKLNGHANGHARGYDFLV